MFSGVINCDSISVFVVSSPGLKSVAPKLLVWIIVLNCPILFDNLLFTKSPLNMSVLDIADQPSPLFVLLFASNWKLFCT